MAEPDTFPTGMSRGDRRRFKRLAEATERVVEGDRLFFARHPTRNHRLRLASSAEVAILEITQGTEATRLLPGYRWYVLLRQIEKGIRLRRYLTNFEGEDTDGPELALKIIFDRQGLPGSQSSAIEASLRGFLEQAS